MAEPDGPVYPNNGTFQLKQPTVQAMQYEGTTANAYEILAWVLRNSGAGSLDMPDQLNIGDQPVSGNSWVVLDPNSGYKVMSDEGFRATYEPLVVNYRG
jgi:hypothetical protein